MPRRNSLRSVPRYAGAVILGFAGVGYFLLFLITIPHVPVSLRLDVGTPVIQMFWVLSALMLPCAAVFGVAAAVRVLRGDASPHSPLLRTGALVTVMVAFATASVGMTMATFAEAEGLMDILFVLPGLLVAAAAAPYLRRDTVRE